MLYLALIYHLGRPGSEIDPQTLKQTEHGLLEVAQTLHPQLNAPAAVVDLQPYQLVRLGQAMLGTINELKAYPMLRSWSRDAREEHSTVLGFDEVLTALFPDVIEDENVSFDLAEAMMMLRRRLDSVLREAEETLRTEQEATRETKSPRSWQFWRR